VSATVQASPNQTRQTCSGREGIYICGLVSHQYIQKNSWQAVMKRTKPQYFRCSKFVTAKVPRYANESQYWTMEIYGMTGERLGEIGIRYQKSLQEQDLPQWKKDFMSKPSVSIRDGIAWVSYSSSKSMDLPSLSGSLTRTRLMRTVRVMSHQQKTLMFLC
jgi:hypothetical protein